MIKHSTLLKKTSRFFAIVAPLLIIWLHSPNAVAQDAKKDSLENVLNEAGLPPGERVFTMGRLAAHCYFNGEKERADSLLEEALQLAHTLRDKQYLAKTLAIQAMQLRILGQPDAADEAIASALKAMENNHSVSINGYVRYAKGWLEKRNNNSTEAVESYIDALKFYDQSADPADDAVKSSIYSELYSTYGDWGDYKNMEKYARLELAHARKSGSPDALASALYSLAHTFEAQYRNDATNRAMLDSANHYYRSSVAIFSTSGDRITVQSQRPFNALGMANLYSEFYPLSYQDSAKRYLEIAVKEGLKTKQYTVVSGAYGIMYEYAQRQNRWNDAENYLNQAARYIQKEEMPDIAVLARIMESLATVSERKGDYKAALQHYKTYLEYYKARFDNEKMALAKELEAKYASEVREQKLLLLEAQVNHRKNLNTIYILLSAAIFIALIFLFIAYRQRSKALVQQRYLHELELNRIRQEHKISLLSAMIDGQEKERTRIARDLHDGLGGLLSGIKIELSGGIISAGISPAHTLINNALTRIDQAVNELRRIARNMMPELLLKYGLDEAIREFCQSLKRSGVNITFQTFNYRNNLVKNKQVVVYRVAQELINNAVKYAQSRHILVELRQEENSLSLTIEDDGIGFDIHDVRQKGGSGLANVEARVAFLNGQININSTPGTGTTVELNFPI
ncbi:ATP-binding protein [Parapedobacter sp.]